MLQGYGLISVENECGKETDHLQEPIDILGCKKIQPC